jgi:D-beta-D-heptose 7-phosphate kinase / D-beta-D-heptose 1-phosphate adenosyltransferase
MSFPHVDPKHPPRILVVGDLMIDRYLVGSCDRVSPEAPVQIVNVARETRSLGGAGNVIANLTAFGAEATLVAVVGPDLANTPLPNLLERHGVRSDGLIVDEERPTTVKTRVVASRQQIVRFDVETAVAVPAAIEDALLERFAHHLTACDVVVLSDYGKGVLTARVAHECIALGKQQGKPVFVDPKGTDYTKYRGATMVTPNRREAGAAAGIAMNAPGAVSQAGNRLLSEHGFHACLITLSEDGMELFEGGREHRLPTEAREVFDVTGAGDTVIAGVAFATACGVPLLDACRFANRAAGIVVGKLGSATATLAEIQRAMAPQQTGLDEKIIDLDLLCEKLAADRRSGKTVVFTNGCFDLLHAGHVRYLTEARTLGDVLVVGLNSDDSVRRLKGSGRPLNAAPDRALVLAALASVDYIVSFTDDTPLALIRRVLPDVLVKGGDYRAEEVVGADVVTRAQGTVKIIPYLEGKSTSGLIERLKKDTPQSS